MLWVVEGVGWTDPYRVSTHAQVLVVSCPPYLVAILLRVVNIVETPLAAIEITLRHEDL